MKRYLSRIQLAHGLIKIKGSNFDYAVRNYLPQLYNRQSNTLLIKAARQVGKSMDLCAFMIIDSITKPFFSNMYITYSGRQVSDFSLDKLNPILKYSPLIRHYFTDKNSIDRVTEKTFNNGSRISLRSMYRDAELIRGNSADRVCFDEMQDIDPDNTIIALENLSASAYKYKMFCGTTKTGDNNIESYWNESEQWEWHIKCPHCNHMNYQDLKIVGRNSYICNKCGLEIYPRIGEWVALNKNGEFPGYRLTQIMSPTISHKELLYKLDHYPPDKFHNEVLGLPYSLSSRPITENELREVCSTKHMSIPIPHLLDGVLTIDWGSSTMGNSYTVVAIGYWFNNKIQLSYAEKIMLTDPIAQVDYIIHLAKLSKVRVILADYGFGFAQNALLKQKLESSSLEVYPIYYTESSTHIHWKSDSHMWTVNRTWSLAQTFNTIKLKQIDMPNYDEMKNLFKDVLAEFVDYRTPAHSEVMFYTHNKAHPDDFLHALNYLILGLKLFVTKELHAED